MKPIQLVQKCPRYRLDGADSLKIVQDCATEASRFELLEALLELISSRPPMKMIAMLFAPLAGGKRFYEVEVLIFKTRVIPQRSMNESKWCSARNRPRTADFGCRSAITQP